MAAHPGTDANPLRVAIIGSGPSGFYAAEQLQKQEDRSIQLDMFERLPTPFGLVRGGVAPDHPKIKSVTRVYDRIAAHPDFRFFGNVTFGADITHDDLTRHYHQIIYATGAQTDRRLGIPGEDLPGSHAATEFVAWYNGHPDYRDLTFDLSQERAAVVGNGNVAMDVARILAKTYEELRETDIADYALEALRHSQVRAIYVLGRRGPAQAAFTNPELKELGDLADADVIVAPDEVELDPLSREWLMTTADRNAERNVQTLMRYASSGDRDKSRRIYLRFLVSPTQIFGRDHVEALRIVKNELYRRDDGTLRPRQTGAFETLPVGLVFRSIGYQAVPLPGVPFDHFADVIPNERGRVIDLDRREPIPGEYAVGWIKRGPTGIIGTNKPDAQETVQVMLEDQDAGRMLQPENPERGAMERLLAVRKPDYVTYKDWQTLDEIEVRRGQEAGRPRVKFTRVEEILNALAAYRGRAQGQDGH
ncbi:MAG: FAD-dependent oxidoreductase [Anaerolineae bacterium]|nr:FAD-dependent oxidoreductase [Anaerolineae bacterium]